MQCGVFQFVMDVATLVLLMFLVVWLLEVGEERHVLCYVHLPHPLPVVAWVVLAVLHLLLAQTGGWLAAIYLLEGNVYNG